MTQRVEDPGLGEGPAASARAGRAVAPPKPAGGGPSPRAERRARQARVVIRKVGPWSVFKLSLLFYFCVMLVILLALGMLYSVLGAVGAIDSVTRLARDLFADQSFEIHGGWIFTRLTLIGIAMVLVWSLINVFVAFLYNLISDVLGGLEVTLADRR